MHLSASAMGITALFTSSALSGAQASILPDFASINEHPYHVSIEQAGQLKCSGALIYHSFVLTAAGCVTPDQDGDGEYTVRAGTSEPNTGGQVVGVSSIQLHPLFDAQSGLYDVAVITLAEDLAYTDSINQVLMVKAGDPLPQENTSGIVTGWSDIHLQAWDSSVFNRDSCPQIYAQNHPQQGFRPLAASMFCAAFFEGDESSCQRDVGSPLVEWETGKLIGLASSLTDCVPWTTPGLYTSIAYVHSFITLVTGL